MEREPEMGAPILDAYAAPSSQKTTTGSVPTFVRRWPAVWRSVSDPARTSSVVIGTSGKRG
jgi:hypothetical protein